MRRHAIVVCFGVLPLFGQEAPSVVSPILPMDHRPIVEDRTFQWRSAFNESVRFTFLQHGLRLAFQPGTRKRLGGPFLSDYVESVTSLKGWGDDDPVFINYIGHPMQGAISGYIQIQNDPRARQLEFGTTKEYWRSRLKALAWNTAYSTQFEVGPISESSIGNVGQRKGTSGYVDLVMTPAGGFAWMIAEDWLDKRFVQRWEDGTSSVAKRTFLRIAFNPGRSIANMLRGKGPWHREGRALLPPKEAAVELRPKNSSL